MTSLAKKDGQFQKTLADSLILIWNSRSSTGLIPVYIIIIYVLQDNNNIR